MLKHYSWDGMPEWVGDAYEGNTETDVVIEGSRYAENPVTFQAMKEMSELFGTEMIFFGIERRDDGYCETCSDPYSVVVICITQPTRFPPGWKWKEISCLSG